MSESGKKELNEQDLGDIILCEPITNRGLQALQGLGLQNVVTENFFFGNLYTVPKYYDEQYLELIDKQSSDINKDTNKELFLDITDEELSNIIKKEYLHYNYSITAELFKEKNMKLKYFDTKFTSDIIDHSPLYIIGTTGNGKSIEAYAKIRNPERDNETIESNRIVYNLENTCTELTYGLIFKLNKKQKNNALWLICVVLLDELYKLVDKNHEKVLSIASNHNKYLVDNKSADEIERKIFDRIKDYNPIDPNTGEQMFEYMIKLINDNDASQSIRDILKITMNLMYCINPRNKNYIVFDNLEQFIRLNAQYIVIHNSVLSDLCESVEEVTGNLKVLYDRIETDESWRAFKIIIVMRRTSGHLVEKNSVHYATKLLGKGNDYTGHFDIWRIWEKKKEHLWEKYLKEKYDLKQSSDVLWIIDNMMNDRPFAVTGTSYQELISPLMNTGIRRNGRAQAHTVMNVYNILLSVTSNCYINYGTYKYLLEEKTKESTAIRYMYRRALLEIQYKWMIIQEDARPRFENLFLGKLSKKKESDIKDKNGNIIIMRSVVWDNPNKNNTTLVRRILSYLSNFMDSSTYEEKSNGSSFGTGMFATKSLYDLMKCIFLNPSEDKSKILNYNEHFLPLAKVLASLGNMSHSATKAAPFLILDINDPRINSIDSESQIADILREIWDTGAKNDSVNDSYNYGDFGVRLTEAGHVFLCDIQPSFSFFAALYCIEEVPLFFLTDPERIKFVIKSIYKAANDLCNVYEQVAHNFCTKNNTLREDNYLPKYHNEYITFRHRVKDLHSHHLGLYSDYIEKNAEELGLTDVKADLKDYIKKFISEYKKWKTGRRSANCF